MSAREAHLFVFSGAKIAEAANRIASDLRVDILDLEAQLFIHKRAALIALEIDFEEKTIERLSCFFPDEPSNVVLNPSQVATGWASEGPAPTVTFQIEAEQYRPILVAASKIRDARKQLDEYERAAARYGSQPKVAFELDEKDVNYFGLDKGAA